MFVYGSLEKSLKNSPEWFIALFGAVCSFCVYFSMYAFRKPFTAAGFEGKYFLHIDYKIWLVTAQVIGYMISKFFGIKYISGIERSQRANAIVTLILISWVALFFFAIIPSPWNIIFLLVNGLPLGMVWGLVFSYLEGRQQTEFMGAVLAVSFIFSSGVVKSLGKALIINQHISEFWMPFLTGSFFVIPTLLFTWLLNHLPVPTSKDIMLRTERKPMTTVQRKSFIKIFLPGIIVIVITYIFLSILRDFRDNFANELWSDLGYRNQASIFTKTEIPISIIVLFAMSLLIIIKNNMKAFIINHFIILGGFTLSFFATLLFNYHKINGIWWMIMIGTGLYLAYVPFNALYFERMIASFRIKGNVGFIMYISDAFGYLGSVMVLCIKQFFGLHVTWTNFFIDTVFLISGLGIAGMIAALYYFKVKYNLEQINPHASYAVF